MKRQYSVVKDPEVGAPGDENAMAAGLALANRFDGPTLRLIHDTFSALELIGGQLAAVAHREKFDDWGNLISREQHREVPGQWQTAGYIFHYENRSAHMEQLEPIPEDADLADGDSFVPDHAVAEVEDTEADEAA